MRISILVIRKATSVLSGQDRDDLSPAESTIFWLEMGISLWLNVRGILARR